jgi:hypothetical protein
MLSAAEQSFESVRLAPHCAQDDKGDAWLGCQTKAFFLFSVTYGDYFGGSMAFG